MKKKQQKKYDAHMEALRAKAPNSITYEDCWDLKGRLASIIADHLRAFIYWEKNSPYGGIAGPVAQKWSDPEKALSEWLKILRKMLYAFESFRSRDLSLPSPEENGQEDENRKFNYDDDRIREGMQLFIDYWDYLWI